jgi:hypothetical protein
LPRSLTRMKGNKMRRINEFKSYRSAVDYDSKTGQFVITPLPDVFSEEDAEETQLASAEIVLFPEPETAPQKQRLAG